MSWGRVLGSEVDRKFLGSILKGSTSMMVISRTNALKAAGESLCESVPSSWLSSAHAQHPRVPPQPYCLLDPPCSWY